MLMLLRCNFLYSYYGGGGGVCMYHMIEDVMKIKDRVNAIPLRKLKMKVHSRISYLLVDVEMSTIVQKGEKLLGIAAYLTLSKDWKTPPPRFCSLIIY